VMRSITRFITQRLKLKVNETKSAEARPQERKFLGFGFTDGPEVRRTIAPTALLRFKDKIREITRQAKRRHKHRDDSEATCHLYGGMARMLGLCETPRR